MMSHKERGLRIESRSASRPVGACAHSSLLGPRSVRSGVTLVELLVTILIIGILAAMILGIAAVAGNTAREAKTRNIITRLHTLLMEQADSYKTRRVKVRQKVIDAINQSTYTPAEKGILMAQARLYALREMMLMEMPDRWSDVLLNDVPNPPVNAYDARYPVYLENRTDLANVYLRRYDRLAKAGIGRNQLLVNQGAECLYIVITTACGDGEARSQFHESDIGDTDGDGAPEFLDGWGNPISFLRWAPGFLSQIQLRVTPQDARPTSATDPNPNAQAWLQAANTNHDPFDMYRVESWAFHILPVIYSAGRDESYGLFDAGTVCVWTGIEDPGYPFNLNNSPPPLTPLTPYQKYVDISPEGPLTTYLGSDDGSKTSTDNIHNHLIKDRT